MLNFQTLRILLLSNSIQEFLLSLYLSFLSLCIHKKTPTKKQQKHHKKPQNKSEQNPKNPKSNNKTKNQGSQPSPICHSKYFRTAWIIMHIAMQPKIIHSFSKMLPLFLGTGNTGMDEHFTSTLYSQLSQPNWTLMMRNKHHSHGWRSLIYTMVLPTAKLKGWQISTVINKLILLEQTEDCSLSLSYPNHIET